MKKTPVILGITAFNHDSSACIIKDGRLLAFAEEERFCGIKHTGQFPTNAIAFCISEAGIDMKELTDLAFYFSPGATMISYLRNNNPLLIFSQPSVFLRCRFFHELIWLFPFLVKCFSLKRHFPDTPELRVHFVAHHVCHLWYGIHASSFHKGIILSNDSVGEALSTLAVQFNIRNGKVSLKPCLKQKDPHSIGYLYGAVTQYLGYRRGEGEGTVMGLASFGDDRHVNFFQERCRLLAKGRFQLSSELVLPRSFRYQGERLGRAFKSELGGRTAYTKNRPNGRDEHIAFALQAVTEKLLAHQIGYLNTDQLVLVGGVAQNSAANGKLARIFTDKHMHVPPIPHDAGCSIGAAVKVWYDKIGRLSERIGHSFLGPAYDDEAITNILNSAGIHYEISHAPIREICQALSQQQVVLCFKGRMEGGPRALGNRSILASPEKAEMPEYLNEKVKFREHFRPYGGIALEEDLSRIAAWKSGDNPSPWMTHVFPVHKTSRMFAPALIHVDDTMRIQAIPKQTDPFMEALLAAWKQLTGCPVLINTSLNIKGKPIARTPRDALAVLFTTGAHLAIFNEKIIVRKR